MSSDCGVTAGKPRRKRKVTETASLNNRSRITNGRDFLPCVHEQSIWARTCRDGYAEILSDQGGADFLAAKIGKIREDGGEPEPHQQDLYTRLLNAERRQCETLGWQRKPRDITPSLTEVMARHAAEKAEQARKAAEPAEAVDG